MEFIKIYNDTIKETVFEGNHKTGLKVYVMPKKGYSKTYAMFATKFGSVNNVYKKGSEKYCMPDGIAHFLEHKVFETKTGNAFDEYAKTGASANAFTSFNTTAYLFSCTDKFEENLRILLNFVQTPYFTKENVAKEQGIIGQEIRMYDDDPNWRVFFNLLTALYVDHPVKIDIAGTVESISEITHDMLNEIHGMFYHPSNMILFVAGDVDVNKVFDITDELIIDKGKTEYELCPHNENQAINKKYTEQKLDVSKPLFMLGFKDLDVGYTGKKLLKKDIINEIILETVFGKSGRFYQNLYSQGLIDDSFESEHTLEEDYGFTIVGGESSDPKKVSELIVAEINRIKKVGICKETCERIKKVIYGRHLKTYNSVDAIVHSYVSDLITGINPLDFTEVYFSITYDDIKNRFETHFNEENMALSVILPQ